MVLKINALKMGKKERGAGQNVSNRNCDLTLRYAAAVCECLVRVCHIRRLIKIDVRNKGRASQNVGVEIC